jgi:hypothetical protein
VSADLSFEVFVDQSVEVLVDVFGWHAMAQAARMCWSARARRRRR